MTLRAPGRAIYLLLACALQLMQCSELGGNSSQTGSPKIVGILCNTDGTRAKHATVKFVPSAYNPKTASKTIDSTRTDDTGGYQFESLPPDTYNVLGNSATGSALSYRDSVVVHTDIPMAVPADTLKAPGSLRGVIRLDPGDDSRTVLILVMGTGVWTMPQDSIGNFSLAAMAAGHYRVRLLSTLDKYQPLDTTLSIASGATLTLPDTLRLKSTGTPAPSGFRVTYDSLQQIVTLHWNGAATGLVKGYIVYRKATGSDSEPTQLTTQAIADTLYRDSTAAQDSAYDYQIAAVSGNGVVGTKSAAIGVKVTSVFTPLGSFGGSGDGPGQFSGIYDIKVLKSGSVVALDGPADRAELFNGNGTFVSSWGGTGSTSGKFRTPVSIAEDDSGFIYILEVFGTGRIQKFDPAGTYLASWTVGPYSRGLAYSTGKLYVVATISSGLPGIKVVDLNTDSVTEISPADSSPNKIAVDASSKIYLSDDQEMKIYAIAMDGTVSASWGGSGSQNGAFSNPSAIAFGPQGRVFVADENNGRVQVFSTSGGFITKLVLGRIPEGSTEVNEENRADALSFDNAGHLFVADKFFIHKYSVNLP